MIQSTFQSGIIVTDGGNAALQINNWVDEQTDHKIKDIVTPGEFLLKYSINQTWLTHNFCPKFLEDVSGDAIVLINALYFQAQWDREFSKDLTKPRPFYQSRFEMKMVPTMQYINSNFYTGTIQDIDARFVILPYKVIRDNKFSQWPQFFLWNFFF